MIGLVYATGSKLPRRIIIPTADSELNDPHHVQPGETMIQVPNGTPVDLNSQKALIAQHAGVAVSSIPDGRCAVIDGSNNVVAVIVADHTLDSIAGHTLMPHATASPGDTIVGGIVQPKPTA